MLHAIIAMQTAQANVNQIAQAVADIEGVAEVYSVTGEWDIVAMVRVKQNDDLARVVTEEIVKIEGIERTNTMVAFQAFSRYDLEHMFSIGMDESRKA